MTCDPVKKFLLALLLIVLMTGPSFALNKAKAMRFLMVNSMMEYGQALYDRGDYPQACAVFDHVLGYDNHQRAALDLEKKMGCRRQKSVEVMVEDFDTPNLQQMIDMKRQSIERLQSQIRQMRENISSQLPQ